MIFVTARGADMFTSYSETRCLNFKLDATNNYFFYDAWCLKARVFAARN